MVAEKLGKKQVELQNIVCKVGAPKYEGTSGGSRFHDDKSTYTGVASKPVSSCV